MAHHNSTPQKVLDAPEIDEQWLETPDGTVIYHTGMNRALRRLSKKRFGGDLAPSGNTTYVKEV